MRYALIPFWGLLKRELIRDLRRPRPMLLLAGVLAVAALVVAQNYPDALMPPTFMALRSTVIFGGLTATLFVAAIVLLPGYAATSIVVERESDTFDLLLLTLTRPTAIVLGKLTSALGFFVLIELAMLPFISATMFLVGTDARFVGLAAAYLAIVAVTCCSMGIMASALARNTPRAVSLSYVCAFIALGGYLIPFGFLFVLAEVFKIAILRPLAEPVMLFLMSFSPLGVYRNFIFAFAGGGAFSGVWSLVRIVLGQGVFSVLSLLVARRGLRRKYEERSFTSVAPPPPLPGAIVETRPAFRDARALPPWPPVRDGANPLLARELLQVRLMQRMTPLRFLLIAVAVIPTMLIVGYVTSEPSVRVRSNDAHLVVHTWMVGLAIMMAFVAPGSCAALWSREYERETIDLLRMSLLTPAQMTYGKIVAALRACVYPLMLALIATLPLLQFPFMSPHAAIQFVAGSITIAVTTIECVAVATFMGLLGRRTSSSILYGIAGSMTAICSPFLVTAAIEILTAFRADDWLLWPWLNLSPITAYTSRLGPNERIGADDFVAWSICMAAQLAFAIVVTFASVRLVARRHLQDR